MPTLIRLFIVLLVLAAIALAGMLTLSIMVDPGQKEVRVRVPVRDNSAADNSDPLGIRSSPAPILTEPATPAPSFVRQPDPVPDGVREVDVPE